MLYHPSRRPRDVPSLSHWCREEDRTSQQLARPRDSPRSRNTTNHCKKKIEGATAVLEYVILLWLHHTDVRRQ